MLNEQNHIIDIDLSITSKKKFRIDKDDNRIIELNTSDMNIISRLSEVYPKLEELQAKATQLTSTVDIKQHDENDIEGTLNEYKVVGDNLKDIDKSMRDLIDYIFDSKVADIAAPDGSMYDLFNGSFRYEHIITTFMALYEDNLKAEYDRLEKQTKKHTAKYTK